MKMLSMTLTRKIKAMRTFHLATDLISVGSPHYCNNAASSAFLLYSPIK